MDRLPIELLQQIFVHACTDGGKTGAALSRVSKFIHAASRPTRFHSVALVPAAPQRVAQLLTVLRLDCGGAEPVPPIRHLCLSVVGDFGFGFSSSPFSQPTSPPSDLTTTADEHARYAADVSALLRHAARSLETLAFVHCHGLLDIASLCDLDCGPAGFPALRELTLVGSYPFAEGGAPGAGAPMPRLARLHLAIPGAYLAGMELTPWPERAPALTHLRLTNFLRPPAGLQRLLPLDQCTSSSRCTPPTTAHRPMFFSSLAHPDRGALSMIVQRFPPIRTPSRC